MQSSCACQFLCSVVGITFSVMCHVTPVLCCVQNVPKVMLWVLPPCIHTILGWYVWVQSMWHVEFNVCAGVVENSELAITNLFVHLRWPLPHYSNCCFSWHNIVGSKSSVTPDFCVWSFCFPASDVPLNHSFIHTLFSVSLLSSLTATRNQGWRLGRVC